MKKNTTFITIVFFCMMLSMVTLAWIAYRQQDPRDHKSWWAVSFVHPLPSSPDTTIRIENFTSHDQFDVTVQSNDNKRTQTYYIAPGTSMLIPSSSAKNKITVIIAHGDEVRTLYK